MSLRKCAPVNGTTPDPGVELFSPVGSALGTLYLLLLRRGLPLGWFTEEGCLGFAYLCVFLVWHPCVLWWTGVLGFEQCWVWVRPVVSNTKQWPPLIVNAQLPVAGVRGGWGHERELITWQIFHILTPSGMTVFINTVRVWPRQKL